jgi:hypothetical protein
MKFLRESTDELAAFRAKHARIDDSYQTAKG